MTISIDATQLVRNYKGKPLDFSDSGKPDEIEPMTVADAIGIACNNQMPQETLSGDQKNRGFKISARVFANDTVKLTAKDVAFILERSGIVNTTLVHGRLQELLDPEDVEDEPDDETTEAKDTPEPEAPADAPTGE